MPADPRHQWGKCWWIGRQQGGFEVPRGGGCLPPPKEKNTSQPPLEEKGPRSQGLQGTGERKRGMCGGDTRFTICRSKRLSRLFVCPGQSGGPSRWQAPSLGADLPPQAPQQPCGSSVLPPGTLAQTLLNSWVVRLPSSDCRSYKSLFWDILSLRALVSP